MVVKKLVYLWQEVKNITTYETEARAIGWIIKFCTYEYKIPTPIRPERKCFHENFRRTAKIKEIYIIVDYI